MGEVSKELLHFGVRGRRRFELAALAAFLDPRRDFPTLAFKKIANRFCESRMREEVHAARERGVESAQPFVFAARARLEAGQSALDAVLDAGVVADVEMQEFEILEASPIASVQDAGFFKAEASRD